MALFNLFYRESAPTEVVAATAEEKDSFGTPSAVFQTYYVDAYHNIRSLNTETGENELVVKADQGLYDLAFLNGSFYGVDDSSGGRVLKINAETGETTVIASQGTLLNALGSDGQGTLYAAGPYSENLYAISENGDTTVVGQIGKAGGDLVVLNNAVYMTNTSNDLVKFDLDTKEVTKIADVPKNAYGLSVSQDDNVLYLFEGNGDVNTVDLTTGQVTEIHVNIYSSGKVYGGATEVVKAPENEDPIANDDDASGNQDNDIVIAVSELLKNDSDPDGDTLFEFSVQDATNGIAYQQGDNVVFEPKAGYSGPASFTYTITDGKGGFDTATVNLTIEAAPTGVVATNDEVDGYANNNVVIAPDVLLGNDDDLAGGNIYGVGLGDAVNGAVYFDGTNVVFVPEAEYTGPASFTYTIKNDAGELDTATVNLTITPKVVEGTDGDDAEVTGSSASETIIGGLGSDNLYGAEGADTFVWRLEDVSDTPSIDVIKDGQAIDKIDISDLLQGEENGEAGLTKAEVLDSYLNLSTDDNGNTVMEINATGAFGTEGAAVDQTIVIEGFDLTGANTLSDVQIINNLINNLITD